jgi:hypothetical protein
MTEGHSARGRVAVLLAALATVGTVVAYAAATAAADGRTLEANFCGTSHACMTITFDGATVGTPTRTDATQPDLTLRPGTYWITVTDNSNFHNFSLRSCPGSTALCTSDNPASGGVDEDITPICNDPLTPAGSCPRTNPAANVIVEPIKVNLEHGTYRLFCDAPGHEGAGMYVEIAVGGVGQVG